MVALSEWLPFVSLAVALLAVVVGPWVTWRVTKYQSDVSLRLANKQIIAPMRQAWINRLREATADLLSIAWWYYVSGQAGEEPEDNDHAAGIKVERRLRFLLQEIDLMLNPVEDDHRALYHELDQVIGAAFPGSGYMADFSRHHAEATRICKTVLKREWEVTKMEGLTDGATAISSGLATAPTMGTR